MRTTLITVAALHREQGQPLPVSGGIGRHRNHQWDRPQHWTAWWARLRHHGGDHG